MHNSRLLQQLDIYLSFQQEAVRSRWASFVGALAPFLDRLTCAMAAILKFLKPQQMMSQRYIHSSSGLSPLLLDASQEKKSIRGTASWVRHNSRTVTRTATVYSTVITLWSEMGFSITFRPLYHSIVIDYETPYVYI
jgi:hypothetical protein